MTSTLRSINLPVLLITLLCATVLLLVGWQRLAIEYDVVSSLPHNDPVIDNATRIFQNHPMQNQVAIDVSLDVDDPDQLTGYGLLVTERLMQSGLFKSIGMADLQAQLPLLVDHVVDHLPLLFSAEALETVVAPLLTPQQVDSALQRWHSELSQMGGIGQARYIAQDPLGLKDPLLARLIHLAPSSTAHIHKGQLISADGRHLLVTATPIASGTDTDTARSIAALLDRIAFELQQANAARGVTVTLTPVGAYRAALDNEEIIRQDVERALLFSTLGVAILLLLAFPRPLLGLLSMLPAVVGTMAALFVWSLIYPSISILVLGFGGAIISISVDHGIAYLLFLDRPEKAYGKSASREVWSVGIFATLTTMGAFAALSWSDFAIFRQVGQFAALGTLLSSLFVHFVFPKIFPLVHPSRQRWLPLPKVADRLFGMGSMGAWVALIFFVMMAFFATPGFNIDVGAMNTVSQSSQDAEKKLMTVWGGVFNKIFLMIESPSLPDLQIQGDRLLADLESEPDGQFAERLFLPSLLFPGSQRAADNLAAWRQFWYSKRVEALRLALQASGERYGFADGAFAPFLQLTVDPRQSADSTVIPETFFNFLGITKNATDSTYRQFATLTLPANHSSESFFARYGQWTTVFDPTLFSRHLGDLMFKTFTQLWLIVTPAIVILLLIFFLDVKLTLIALLPMVFATVGTLGSLNLMGRQLDIPGLMIAVFILGIGIDYSLFLVCSYQRYGRPDHPSFSLIRSAVVMTSASALIGFGVMVFARHALLKSVGITSLLGIGYSALGAFLILPPVMKRWLAAERRPGRKTWDIQSRVRARFRSLEPYPRLFAHFKMRMDSMFKELPEMLTACTAPRTIIDIGSGLGVPACWLAEYFASVHVYGIEPDPERVRVANRALGEQGSVVCGLAPDLPPAPPADAAVMLDMIHFLADAQLVLAFERLHAALKGGGDVLIRAVMQPTRRVTWVWWLELLKQKRSGVQTHYRTSDHIAGLLSLSGFAVERMTPSGAHGELLWFRSRKVELPNGDKGRSGPHGGA